MRRHLGGKTPPIRAYRRPANPEAEPSSLALPSTNAGASGGPPLLLDQTVVQRELQGGLVQSVGRWELVGGQQVLRPIALKPLPANVSFVVSGGWDVLLSDCGRLTVHCHSPTHPPTHPPTLLPNPSSPQQGVNGGAPGASSRPHPHTGPVTRTHSGRHPVPLASQLSGALGGDESLNSGAFVVDLDKLGAVSGLGLVWG